MNGRHVQLTPLMLTELVGELERNGSGRPAAIARPLGPDWTKDTVLAARAELFPGDVVGHNHELGLRWVA